MTFRSGSTNALLTGIAEHLSRFIRRLRGFSVTLRANITDEMAAHNEFGRAGEDVAVDFLTEHGYDVLDRNWRSGHKELDIVAEKDGVLVVVEVKTRKTAMYGRPEESVSPLKIRKIVLAADAYVRYNRLDMPVRFDIISIVAGKDGAVKHIVDAFRSPVWYG